MNLGKNSDEELSQNQYKAESQGAGNLEPDVNTSERIWLPFVIHNN